MRRRPGSPSTMPTSDGAHVAGSRFAPRDGLVSRRSARDGRAIDTIGHYNPRTDPIELVIDEGKAKDWLSKGAQPSDTVKRLFKQAGVTPTAK